MQRPRLHYLEEALFSAISDEKPNTAIRLIKTIQDYKYTGIGQKPTLYAINSEGENYLSMAIKHKLPDLFSKLLHSGAFSHSQDSVEILFGTDNRGKTLFTKAAQFGHSGILIQLYNRTLVVFNALHEDEKKKYDKIWLKADQMGNTPLHYAAQAPCSPEVKNAKFNNIKSCEFILDLIQKEENAFQLVNLKNKNGNTALHFATNHNNIAANYEIIELLFDAGADLTALNEHRQSPFLNLCTRQNIDALKFVNKMKSKFSGSPSKLDLRLTQLYRDYLYDHPNEQIQAVYFSLLRLHSLQDLIIGKLEFNTDLDISISLDVGPNCEQNNGNTTEEESDESLIRKEIVTILDKHLNDSKRLNTIVHGLFAKQTRLLTEQKRLLAEQARLAKQNIDKDKRIIDELIEDFDQRLLTWEQLSFTRPLSGRILSVLVPITAWSATITGIVYSNKAINNFEEDYEIHLPNGSSVLGYRFKHDEIINATHYDCNVEYWAGYTHNNPNSSAVPICTGCCEPSTEKLGLTFGVIFGNMFSCAASLATTCVALYYYNSAEKLLPSDSWSDLLDRLNSIIEKVQSSPNDASDKIESEVTQLAEIILSLSEDKQKKKEVIEIFTHIKNILNNISQEMEFIKRPLYLTSTEETSEIVIDLDESSLDENSSGIELKKMNNTKEKKEDKTKDKKVKPKQNFGLTELFDNDSSKSKSSSTSSTSSDDDFNSYILRSNRK